MKNFQSFQSYFHFQKYVKNFNRFFLDNKNKQFFEALKETCNSRIIDFKKGNNLWRAQLGYRNRPYYQDGEHVTDIPYPVDTKRMKPIKDQAFEGRANPKGISYLYLSSDKETAMAEIRPWIGMYISVGQFKIVKDLKLVDFSKDNKRSAFLIFGPNQDKEVEDYIWASINNAFSTPVTPTDNKAEYVPTQIISEFIKNMNFDGIVYKSSLSDGYNIALFDTDSAEQINCFLFELKKIKFDFSETGESYFIKEYYKITKKNALPAHRADETPTG